MADGKRAKGAGARGGGKGRWKALETRGENERDCQDLPAENRNGGGDPGVFVVYGQGRKKKTKEEFP